MMTLGNPLDVLAADYPVLKVDCTELVDALLNLCRYTHPETLHLPKG